MAPRRLLPAGLSLLLGAAGLAVGLAAPSHGAVGVPSLTTITVPLPATTVTVSTPITTTTVATPTTTPTVTVTTPTLPSVTSTSAVTLPSTQSVRQATTAATVPAHHPPTPGSSQPGAATSGTTGPAAAIPAAQPSPSSAATPGSRGSQGASASAAAASSMPARRNTASVAVAQRSGTRGAVTLLLHLPHAGALRIKLIGPSPSCVTARTLVRHAHAGLNRVPLGPTAVRGLKSGVYLVRIPVPNRPLPLRAAVTITPGRRIVANRERSAIERVCGRGAVPTFSAGTAAGGAAGRQPPPGAAPSHHHHRGGLIPHSIRKAIRDATAGAGRAVAKAGSSTALLLLFCALVALAGFFLVYPLARHLLQRRRFVER